MEPLPKTALSGLIRVGLEGSLFSTTDPCSGVAVELGGNISATSTTTLTLLVIALVAFTNTGNAMLENAGLGTRLTLVIRLNCLNEAVTGAFAGVTVAFIWNVSSAPGAFFTSTVNARWIPGVMPLVLFSGL